MSDLIERLEYIAAILDANKDKFAVPDHITAKAKTVREAAARIRVLEGLVLEAGRYAAICSINAVPSVREGARKLRAEIAGATR